MLYKINILCKKSTWFNTFLKNKQQACDDICGRLNIDACQSRVNSTKAYLLTGLSKQLSQNSTFHHQSKPEQKQTSVLQSSLFLFSCGHFWRALYVGSLFDLIFLEPSVWETLLKTFLSCLSTVRDGADNTQEKCSRCALFNWRRRSTPCHVVSEKRVKSHEFLNSGEIALSKLRNS